MSLTESRGTPGAVTPDGSRFRHEALFYAGVEQFVRRTARYVREALAAAEPVLVAVVEPRAKLLREELGAEADAVEFFDMERVGRNPARIIPAWQDWAQRNLGAGSRFRGVSEPLWPGRTSAEIRECQKHEQLLEAAFTGGPAWSLLCPYDLEALPVDVIAAAHRAHAGISTGNVLVDPLPDLGAPIIEVRFDLDALADLRAAIRSHAAELGLADLRMADFVLVADELAANSVRHGGGSGVLRLWRQGDYAVCEVHDLGVITDPLVGRRRPDFAHHVGGAGLWTANLLCDLLLIRSAEAYGTSVRAHFSVVAGG
ncbi:sensor histidine kinase [Actinospica sp. MGRD01-02]|uniref:Sensor histidine kinase n=1 Tax=Actinospica acidithermotolerans TaxID=2828514 RepID=A0A941IFW0_9ACTN|nr:sensor histidine kinase [Actinospica acidithermotolerans]MBR7826770.1 sensor histidine kinase [Actinospica acidithermotolerans]